MPPVALTRWNWNSVPLVGDSGGSVCFLTVMPLGSLKATICDAEFGAPGAPMNSSHSSSGNAIPRSVRHRLRFSV
jgi:hypothetical protein